MLSKAELLATTDDEKLLDLRSNELQRLLPEDVLADPDVLFAKVQTLPRGLRAMAGMHFFDVSMTLDDLAWHFGNQNDVRALRETLDGLNELGLTRIAELFQQAWTIMEQHLPDIRTQNFGEMDFHDWLEHIGAQPLIDPMNKEIWDFCSTEGKFGLLHSWAAYAREHPARCVVLPN